MPKTIGVLNGLLSDLVLQVVNPSLRGPLPNRNAGNGCCEDHTNDPQKSEPRGSAPFCEHQYNHYNSTRETDPARIQLYLAHGFNQFVDRLKGFRERDNIKKRLRLLGKI